MSKKDLEHIFKELEQLAGETESKKSMEKKVEKKKEDSKEIKELKDIKKNLDALEKEVFIKIDTPEKVVVNLVESKKLVKDITMNLMALSKINQLKEEVLEKLRKDIATLNNISKEVEKSLNLDNYVNGKNSSLSEDILYEYVDAIESDIEEIKRNIGLAK